MKIRIVTERRGWILHRMALELQRHLSDVRINRRWPAADLHYYINYGYYDGGKYNGLKVANFTHYDPNHLADMFKDVAENVDHCVAISETTAEQLRSLGIEDNKITTIIIGADVIFRPKLTIGIAGRVYPGGRKGEHLIQALLDDRELMKGMQIVSSHEGWGVAVRHYEDPADFYRSIDYLLVPAIIEGGPVPFMEALACGTPAIAPAVGVVPKFPHIEYERGDIESLKRTIAKVKADYLGEKQKLSSMVEDYNWQAWAAEHEKLFNKLLGNR